MTFRSLLLVSLLAFSTFSTAEVYKWVDKDGKVHFTDKDPAAENKPATETEVITPDPTNTYSPDESGTRIDPPPPARANGEPARPRVINEDERI